MTDKKKKKWFSTGFPGVRYREHPTRKHGIVKDKYFTIRYQKGTDSDGRPIRKEEGLGWASQAWTAEKAFIELCKNKNAATTGEGPKTLKARRTIAQEKEDAQKRERITFKNFYDEIYFPHAKRRKKKNTWTRENEIYQKWLAPAFDTLPLKNVSEIHLEKLKNSMQKVGRAPRTIQYALALVRMIFNHAKNQGYFDGINPTARIKMPRVDNARLRFLTVDEAKRLLDCLKGRDIQTYEISLVALLTGMRFGEIAALTYQDIDVANRLIVVRDPKNKSSRTVYMCDELADLFKSRKSDTSKKPGALVFPHPKGGKHARHPWAFRTAVNDAGLNDGITDRRLKFCFHGLRHTHGSWAAQSGVDILTIKTMLGQKTLVMALRYAHTSAQIVKSGVVKVAKMFESTEAEKGFGDK